MVALPSCHFQLSVERSKPYPKSPRIIGEHILKKRHELGLFQKDVALQLAVNEYTICNWEKNKTFPLVHYLPRIIEFLGYDSYPPPKTLGERVAHRRRSLGFSRKRLAKMLNVDEGTLARFETGIAMPKAKWLQKLQRFLSDGS